MGAHSAGSLDATRVTVELLQNLGLDFEEEKEKAQSVNFKPANLGISKLSVDYSVKHRQMVTRNVVGRLKGSSHAAEPVLYNAAASHAMS